ncbi:MAG: FtsX-like permease family protein [Bacteroidales bacterium]|jgi:putative ABC transport system permease protein|nr:FtsX-like permease family protein [Bacteroidales bacterium]
MIAFKLAIRNLFGAGLRTILNVFILSVAYVVIIMLNGFYQGWGKQARNDSVKWEYGQGQFWQESFDPHDAFTLTDAHGIIPESLNEAVKTGNAAPILLAPATIYPEGRIQSILLKGINVDQNIIDLPTDKLISTGEEVPAIIGTRMAKSINAKVGDFILVRWRDANGTFDAMEVRIAEIFNTTVGSVDGGQFWIPLSAMQQMLDAPNEATLIVAGNEAMSSIEEEGWEFKDLVFLLTPINDLIKSKSTGGAVMYIILLSLAMLAVFDTQILSIFRRQKEIGTLIAMGMTRKQVIGVFTVEGGMHAIFAILMGAAYGGPLLMWMAKNGFSMPDAADDFGVPIAATILPTFSIALILGTIILVTLTTTIVSYIPAKKIAKMNPNDAIRGKIQ